MDVQQLTSASGSSAWSLRDGSDPTGAGPLAGEEAWWLLEPAADHDLPRGADGDGRRSWSPRPRGAALLVCTVVLLVVCVEAGVALLAGMRWFVVQTPSMGVAAPVGSLVITQPVRTRPLPGDVIAFTAPGTPRVYTHRVVSADPSGIRTKGDINATPDPWTIPQAAVLGRSVAILPGAGYALRGAPLFIAGALLLWLLTARMRRRDRRAAARIIGLHVVATAVLAWLHPLVQVVVIATAHAADGVAASIVSTGLLPVRLVDSAGVVLARLTTGRPEVVHVPAGGSGVQRIDALPDAGPMLQLALIGLTVLPAAVVLLVGLPARSEERA